MASLIAVAFVDNSSAPFAWKCSECDAGFSLDRITPNPSLNQLQIVNAHFDVHCRHEYPQDTIRGVAIPAMDEDSVWIAFRVLREATKGK